VQTGVHLVAAWITGSGVEIKDLREPATDGQQRGITPLSDKLLVYIDKASLTTAGPARRTLR
jgi:hypothetical protein